MPLSLKALLDPEQLEAVATDLSIAQLERAQAHLHEFILAEQEARHQRELKRRGDRNLDDMRGLMAKAGISMSELQSALEKL